MENKLILGIDEAGMGPVLGPMVVSGVVIKEEDINYLRSIGVKDSKMFGSGLNAHTKREKVWSVAEKHVVAEKQVVIKAHELDNANMYDLHLDATRKILIELKWEDIPIVYIEQLGGIREKKYFERLCIRHSGFVYESKADIKYAAVSLASIKAKIIRDRCMYALCKELNVEYVSGYPNHVTEEFFRRYYKNNGILPPGTRLSRNWAPIIELK